MRPANGFTVGARNGSKTPRRHNKGLAIVRARLLLLLLLLLLVVARFGIDLEPNGSESTHRPSVCPLAPRLGKGKTNEPAVSRTGQSTANGAILGRARQSTSDTLPDQNCNKNWCAPRESTVAQRIQAHFRAHAGKLDRKTRQKQRCEPKKTRRPSQTRRKKTKKKKPTKKNPQRNSARAAREIPRVQGCRSWRHPAAGVIPQRRSRREQNAGKTRSINTAADPSSAPLPSFPSDSRQSATEHGLARQLIGQLGKTRLANPSAPLVNGHHRLLGGKKTTTTTTTTTTGRDATKNRSGRRPNRQPRADKKKTRQRTTASVARRLMAASTNQRPEKR